MLTPEKVPAHSAYSGKPASVSFAPTKSKTMPQDSNARLNAKRKATLKLAKRKAAGVTAKTARGKKAAKKKD